MNKELLDFYTKQGIRTQIEPETFDSLPLDIDKLNRIIRGIGVHPVDLIKNGIVQTHDRINDRYLKSVQEVIDRVIQLDNRDFKEERKIEDKVIIICKHFAMILCSILRDKGIPSRCRCGFATYFSNGWFEDHWICEYWNGKKWVRVDPQMDKIKTTKKQLENINFSDMPQDIFFTGGVLWQLYRKGIISGEFCGFSHESGENGAWYIRGNMLRDFYALNKIEYTYQETNKLMDKNYEPSEEELLLLDEIAQLTVNPDKHFYEVIDKKIINKVKI